ncbi:NAD(P)/FAD-dependent oxidoreductase [Sphingobacterium sp. LRF_L2]|uniref:NAD(P)/FAD-dependent oxidoreductase n=1 Tax=Sphingobacterium sp. LRF_L2 TaxID=3369421 RepID=UPI003F5EBC1D
MNIQHNTFDAIIIGGSYAGLSAAMSLGRSLRNTLIIDEGLPCNRQTPHSHNFLTQDGKTPATISQIAQEQVSAYPSIQWHDARATTAHKTEKGFVVGTADGRELLSKKIVLATGIKDILPSIPGFADCWGITAIHCPYCHGYEFRDQPTAILAQGERALHLSSLVRNLTDSVHLITSPESNIDDAQLQKLKQNNINVLKQELADIIHQDGHIQKLIFENGEHLSVKALYAGLPFEQHSRIHHSLGCKETEQGYIEIDSFQKTSVPGVFACGDNSSMMRSVANAVATGNLAGAMVNKELVDEIF